MLNLILLESLVGLLALLRLFTLALDFPIQLLLALVFLEVGVRWLELLSSLDS